MSACPCDLGQSLIKTRIMTLASWGAVVTPDCVWRSLPICDFKEEEETSVQ
jgi:hypothetical protein